MSRADTTIAALESAAYARIEELKIEREPTSDETTGLVGRARAGTAVPADAWAALKRFGDIDRQPRS